MSGFAIDPATQATIRANLPSDVLALIDNAKSALQTKADETVDKFRKDVEARLEEFVARDLAAEMASELAAKEQDALAALSKGVSEHRQRVEAINEEITAASGDDGKIQEALGKLVSSTEALDVALAESRKKIEQIGTTAAELGKTAVKKALTGLLG